MKYIVETPTNIHKRIYEHSSDIRVGNLINAFLQHISKSDHNAASMLAYIHKKKDWGKFLKPMQFRFVDLLIINQGFSVYRRIWKNLFWIATIYSIFNYFPYIFSKFSLLILTRISSSPPFSHRYLEFALFHFFPFSSRYFICLLLLHSFKTLSTLLLKLLFFYFLNF